MKGIKEHYVPRFYLKNFGDRFYQYDKKSHNISKCTPKTVAFERDFYAESWSGDISKLEGLLCEIEGQSNTVISNIIKTESVEWLSDIDMDTLCSFVVFQFARTPWFRGWRHSTVQNMSDDVVQGCGIKGWRIVEGDGKPGTIHLGAVLDCLRDMSPYLLQKNVCLSKNDTHVPLWTSDNPVVRYNGLTGRLGFNSPGVQFYLPLTPKLLLKFHDAVSLDLMDDIAAANDIPAEHRNRRDTTKTIDMMLEDVKRANRLQAINSTRFIYSPKQRFHMIKSFLENVEANTRRFGSHAPVSMVSNINGVGITVPDPTKLMFLSGAIDAANDGLDIGAFSHNLQNALFAYRESKAESDTRHKFMLLCDSLGAAVSLPFGEVVTKSDFDAKIHKLTGKPTTALDVFRHHYDAIRNNHKNIDIVQLSKDVEQLSQLVAIVCSARINELQATISISGGSD